MADNERESLIQRLRALYATSNAKQEQYRRETGSGPDVGFLTRESLLIAQLMPDMMRLNIKPEDCI